MMSVDGLLMGVVEQLELFRFRGCALPDWEQAAKELDALKDLKTSKNYGRR